MGEVKVLTFRIEGIVPDPMFIAKVQSTQKLMPEYELQIDSVEGEERVMLHFLPDLWKILEGIPFIQVDAPAFLDKNGNPFVVRPHFFDSISALRTELLKREEEQNAYLYVLCISLICVGGGHYYCARYSHRAKNFVSQLN